jgi:hypothetical protein
MSVFYANEPNCLLLASYSVLVTGPILHVNRLYILLGAHELRARRTMCKSVFFLKSHKLLTDNRGLFRLKEPWSRRFGNPAGRAKIIEKR